MKCGKWDKQRVGAKSEKLKFQKSNSERILRI